MLRCSDDNVTGALLSNQLAAIFAWEFAQDCNTLEARPETCAAHVLNPASEGQTLSERRHAGGGTPEQITTDRAGLPNITLADY